MTIEQQILEQEFQAGFNEAFSQSFATGELNVIKRVIRNSIKLKIFSIEFISKVFELSKERLQEILNDMGLNKITPFF